jgi:hypothetical protein
MYAIVSVANGKLAAEMSSSELRKLSKKLERYLIEEATDEECFIAAGIEATKMGLIPAVDILMVPGHNPSFDTSTCLYIQPMRFSSPILGKAYRYCQLQQLVR